MSIFPVYRKGKISKTIVKFISPKEGYIVSAGSTDKYKAGYLHKDWNHYNDSCWEPCEYDQTIKEIVPENMDLFTTILLEGITASTLTKVPNGYVMTSHSGHQIFIKENTKETLWK